MSDDVIDAFRRRVAQELPHIRQESAIARLVPDPMSGDPPSRYHGLLTGVEHFERDRDVGLRTTHSPLPFSLDFPVDYCSCVDGTLQMRVACVHAPIVHPNVGPGGTVCFGPGFRPATRLRPLLEHLYRIVSGRVFASENAFNPTAADFFRRHLQRVQALRAEPLWYAPVAGSVRVERTRSGGGAG
jgi:hypothetical protein